MWTVVGKPIRTCDGVSRRTMLQVGALVGSGLALPDLVKLRENWTVIREEARRQGKSLRAHYAHLVVHGILHLRGYDHEKKRDARRMERRETAILAEMGVPDPYCDII